MRKALLLSLSLLFLSGCSVVEVIPKFSKSKQELKEKEAVEVPKPEPKTEGGRETVKPEREETPKYQKREVYREQKSDTDRNHAEEEPDIIDELLREVEIEGSTEEETSQPITFSDTLEDLLDIRAVESARPDIWPVMGFVSSKFGWRRKGRRTKKFHAGIDISAPYGSPVLATSAGRVIYAGWIRGYGNVVIIYHGYGFTTLYAHMSSLAVRNKDYVLKGQVIGYVGRSGRATGSHLHYEVLKYGIRQNPILFLP